MSTNAMMEFMTESEQSVPVDSIHIDIRDHSITFEGRKGIIARLLFSDAVYFQTPTESPPEALISPDEGESSPQTLEDEASAVVEATALPETAQPVVLSGRLKSQPREGRPDSRGRPTAWTRLAVHEDDRPDAHLYSATFHRGSARIALRLAADAAITVEGYPHLSSDPSAGRLDTLSVFRVLDYPDKPKKRTVNA